MNQMIVLDGGALRSATPVEIIRDARKVGNLVFPQPVGAGSDLDLLMAAQFRLAPLNQPAVFVAVLNGQDEVKRYFTRPLAEVNELQELLLRTSETLEQGERTALVYALPPSLAMQMSEPDLLEEKLRANAESSGEAMPRYLRAVLRSDLPQQDFIRDATLQTSIQINDGTGPRAATHDEVVQEAFRLNVLRLERYQVACCETHSRELLHLCAMPLEQASNGLLLLDHQARVIDYHFLGEGTMDDVLNGVALASALAQLRSTAVKRAVLVRNKPQPYPRLESTEQDRAERIFDLCNLPRIKVMTCAVVGTAGVDLYNSRKVSAQAVKLGVPLLGGAEH